MEVPTADAWSDQETEEGWSDVVTRRGKKKSGGKGSRDGQEEDGFEEEVENTPEKRHLQQRQARQATPEKENIEQVKVLDTKKALDTKKNKAVVEDHETSTVKEGDEWNDVISRRRKRNPGEKPAEAESKPLPPWRSQPRQPRQSAANKAAAPAQAEDRFSALRPETPAESTPNSRQSKTPTNAVAAMQKSDRFGALENQPAVRAAKGAGKRSEENMSPEEKEKDELKRKVKHDIMDEIESCLDGTCLQTTDFDMRSRQYLHAIHQKGGKPKVHEAFQVVKASTCTKSRDSVRNWPGYVLTLLRKFFNDINSSVGEAPKERASDFPEDTPNSPQLDPKSPPLAPKSPPLAPKASPSNSLSKFTPSLRPQGQ